MSKLMATSNSGDALMASRPVLSRVGAATPVDQAARLRHMVSAMSAGGVSGPGSKPADSATKPSEFAEGSPPVIALTSGKGGVGKTSLSVNLAIALRQLGLRITLIDGDLGLANADVMCGLTPGLRLDAVMSGRAIDSIAIDAPGGFRLVPGTVGISRLADLGPAERQRLLKSFAMLGRQSDAVLLDTGAGINSAVLALLAAADSVVVVMTPEPTSMTDAYALIKCLEQNRLTAQAGMSAALKKPLRISVLVNQTQDFAEAQRVHARLAGVCGRFLALRPAFLGAVGFEPEVTQSIRRRQPLLLSHPRLKWAKQVGTIAKAIVDAEIPQGASRSSLNASGGKGLRSFFESLLGR